MKHMYTRSLCLSLLLTCNFFASDSQLQFEIVPFDYQDADMKEQICAMVPDDLDIQNMTHETEESIRESLLSFNAYHKINYFVCRAVDGSNIIYGYMAYCMSDSAYLIGYPESKDRPILFNSNIVDEFIRNNDHVEPVTDLLNFGFLDNFAVHKHYRGQGLAQAMLHYFEQDCKQHGKQLLVLGVEAENDKAQRAYRKSGFEHHFVHAIAMIKKLN